MLSRMYASSFCCGGVSDSCMRDGIPHKCVVAQEESEKNRLGDLRSMMVRGRETVAQRRFLGGGEGAGDGAVEFADVEGFFDEAAGAGFAGFGFGGAAAGDDDDFGAGTELGEHGRAGEPVDEGHADIHDDQLGFHGGALVDGVLAVGGEADHLVAEVFEHEAQGESNGVCIICNQNLHRRR
jgi:hypothetical protein